MNKELLLQYCDIQREVKDLEKRIDKLKDSAMVGDVVQNGFKGKAYIFGLDLRYTHKIELLQDKLRNKYDKLLEAQTKIEEYIDNIQDSRIRQLIRYRFIDSYPWTKIAYLLNITVDSARKELDRFINKSCPICPI